MEESSATTVTIVLMKYIGQSQTSVVSGMNVSLMSIKCFRIMSRKREVLVVLFEGFLKDFEILKILNNMLSHIIKYNIF